MTRHTVATDVLDATEGDLYAVKELLGHSSTRVTEV
jgi:site-specific recombinase XerC